MWGEGNINIYITELVNVSADWSELFQDKVKMADVIKRHWTGDERTGFNKFEENLEISIKFSRIIMNNSVG
jgi:hypothetical protein